MYSLIPEMFKLVKTCAYSILVSMHLNANSMTCALIAANVASRCYLQVNRRSTHRGLLNTTLPILFKDATRGILMYCLCTAPSRETKAFVHFLFNMQQSANTWRQCCTHVNLSKDLPCYPTQWMPICVDMSRQDFKAVTGLNIVFCAARSEEKVETHTRK